MTNRKNSGRRSTAATRRSILTSVPIRKILIFASYRKDNFTGGGNHYDRADLYVSVSRDGHWTPARHLEHGINTTASESNPTMSPDGEWFYFTSERSLFEIPTKQK